jgi:hypothetical protein
MRNLFVKPVEGNNGRGGVENGNHVPLGIPRLPRSRYSQFQLLELVSDARRDFVLVRTSVLDEEVAHIAPRENDELDGAALELPTDLPK